MQIPRTIEIIINDSNLKVSNEELRERIRRYLDEFSAVLERLEQDLDQGNLKEGHVTLFETYAVQLIKDLNIAAYWEGKGGEE